MVYYTVYKVTNNLNGKYYIGKHKTSNLQDGYYGSGKAIKQAIRKYGKQNFTKEILFVYDNEAEMNQKEQEIVVISEETYNLTIGGKGGFYFINMMGLNVGANNAMHNAESKAKCIEAGKATRSKNPEKYKKISVDNLSKTWETNKGKKRPAHSEFMKKRSAEQWQDQQWKEKWRDKASTMFIVTSPEGVSTCTNRLQEFCEANGLPYVTIWTSAINDRVITKGRAKGWKCQIIAQ